MTFNSLDDAAAFYEHDDPADYDPTGQTYSESARAEIREDTERWIEQNTARINREMDGHRFRIFGAWARRLYEAQQRSDSDVIDAEVVEEE